MSSYDGNATLESWLKHEHFTSHVGELPADVVLLFEPWRVMIEADIDAYLDTDDGDGNNTSWRGWGRGQQRFSDMDHWIFHTHVQIGEKVLEGSMAISPPVVTPNTSELFSPKLPLKRVTTNEATDAEMTVTTAPLRLDDQPLDLIDISRPSIPWHYEHVPSDMSELSTVIFESVYVSVEAPFFCAIELPLRNATTVKVTHQTDETSGHTRLEWMLTFPPSVHELGEGDLTVVATCTLDLLNDIGRFRAKDVWMTTSGEESVPTCSPVGISIRTVVKRLTLSERSDNQKRAQGATDTWQQPGEINTLVGNLPNQGWEAAEHQIGIIQSEIEELASKGIEARNLHELRDGIADALFTVLGLASRVGIDAKADLEAVNDSQYTKFDPTWEDAALTVAKYEALGIQVRQEERTDTQGTIHIVTYSACAQNDHEGRPIPEGKWLKSHRFQEPMFVPLPDDNRLL